MASIMDLSENKEEFEQAQDKLLKIVVSSAVLKISWRTTCEGVPILQFKHGERDEKESVLKE